MQPSPFPSQVAAEAIVTRVRALILATVSASLGGVAVAGCKLMDSRSSLLGVIGSGTVLGIALIIDALRPTRDPVAVAVEQLGQQLRAEMEALHDRVTSIEVKLVGRPSGEGTTERTGSNRAL